MENQSMFDPTRQTVGSLSNEVRAADTKSMQIGDINKEMLKGFIDDVNDALEQGRKEYPDQTFFVLVTEKWEYQMKNALYRKVALSKKRPYPEANTTCFKYDHNLKEVRFCWDLPMRHDMWNIQNSSALYAPQLVEDIQRWERFELEHFGFTKAGLGDQWEENPYFKDRPLGEEFLKFKIYT